jgi:hypothetical protein
MSTARVVRLVHWNEAETAERAARLEAAGYIVDASAVAPESFRASLLADPPAVIVIDLSRLPSHGRDVAMSLRQMKATRGVPIVFVDGAPEKVERTRQQLPDAVFTTWSRIRSDLRRAIAYPPAAPFVPSSKLAGYSGTPLPKKLGIGERVVVALVGAPAGFDTTLGVLPQGAQLRRANRGARDLTIWFVKKLDDLRGDMKSMSAAVGDTPLWIAWPKKTSPLASGVSEREVRELGLAAGLVDYKVCAIDETWSALKFVRRKRQ